MAAVGIVTRVVIVVLGKTLTVDTEYFPEEEGVCEDVGASVTGITRLSSSVSELSVDDVIRAKLKPKLLEDTGISLELSLVDDISVDDAILEIQLSEEDENICSSSSRIVDSSSSGSGGIEEADENDESDGVEDEIDENDDDESGKDEKTDEVTLLLDEENISEDTGTNDDEGSSEMALKDEDIAREIVDDGCGAENDEEGVKFDENDVIGTAESEPSDRD